VRDLDSLREAPGWVQRLSASLRVELGFAQETTQGLARPWLGALYGKLHFDLSLARDWSRGGSWEEVATAIRSLRLTSLAAHRGNGAGAEGQVRGGGAR